MTISTEIAPLIYIGDDSTTVFPYNFNIFASGDLKVTEVVIATGVETVLTLDSDYSVSGVGAGSGNVTLLGGALASTKKLVIELDLELTQTTDYLTGDPFPAQTHESALDRLTMLIQQVKRLTDRSLLQAVTATSALTFPTLSGSKYLFNDGSVISWKALVITTTEYGADFSFGVDANKSASPSVGDLYFATDTNIMYRCKSAGTWQYSIVLDIATVNGLLLAEQGSAIATAASQLGLYVKDVSGTPHIFYRKESNGAEVQITGNRGQVLDMDTTEVTALTSSTSEETLKSLSIPGGTLGTNNAIRVKMWGTMLNNSGGNVVITIKLKFGGTTVLTFGSTSSIGTAAAAKAFFIDAILKADGSVSAQEAVGLHHGHGTVSDGNTHGNTFLATGTAAINSAQAATLLLSGQSDTSHANINLNVKAFELELVEAI